MHIKINLLNLQKKCNRNYYETLLIELVQVFSLFSKAIFDKFIIRKKITEFLGIYVFLKNETFYMCILGNIYTLLKLYNNNRIRWSIKHSI